MAEPTTEETAFSIPRTSSAARGGSAPGHRRPRKAGQIASQKGSSRAQSKITSLSWNQAANENQLKLGAGSGLRESP